MLSRVFLSLLAIAFSLSARAENPAALSPSGAERFFESVRSSPPALRAYLKDFPKGGDLHIHLSGATWAESYLAWAAADGFCVDVAAMALVAPPCDGPSRIPAAQSDKVDPMRSRLIAAITKMRSSGMRSDSVQLVSAAYALPRRNASLVPSAKRRVPLHE